MFAQCAKTSRVTLRIKAVLRVSSLTRHCCRTNLPLRSKFAAERGVLLLTKLGDIYMAKASFIPQKLKPWIEARKKYHLSHAQVQMARELGLNPKKFGGLANHKQETWKLPLPAYIEELYFKHYKKTTPDNVRSIEQMVKDRIKRKAIRKEEKIAEKSAQSTTEQLAPPEN